MNTEHGNDSDAVHQTDRCASAATIVTAERTGDDNGNVQRSPSDPMSEEIKSPAAARKLLRRIDLRLLPILILIYLVNFLDRINISNVMTLGMQEEIGLHGRQVNAALAVFYATYILFEMPSNIMLKKCKPHIWLSLCLFVCGVVVFSHGFVRNFHELIIVRLFLGLAEAGIAPGSAYLLCMWYRRDEALRRFAIFSNSVAMAGAFGSFLASGIAQMDGTLNVAGWRWIFILEGAATCAIAMVAFVLVPDFPEDVKWLNRVDRQSVLERLGTDQSRINRHDSLGAALKLHIQDPKNYAAAVLYFGLCMSGYSVVYFLPTILAEYGYSRVQIQLHVAAPFVVGMVWSIAVAFLSATKKVHFLPIMCNLGLAIIGAGLLLAVNNNLNAMYAATFLIAMGILAIGPISVIWYLMNLNGYMERAIGSAWMVGAGNCGGIPATYMFLKEDAPHYRNGYRLLLVTFFVSAAGACGYMFCCRRQNRSRSEDAKFVAH